MEKIKIFLLGMVEFRLSWTTATDDPELYDWGREIAHILTFRIYDKD